MNGKNDTNGQTRRFWKLSEISPQDGAYWGVLLDGRPVRTPAGAVLAAPTRALAELIAAEWNAVGETVDYAALPATRLAFTAIDRVSATHAAVAAEVARFAGADLLCYFAEAPSGLAERQAALWGPWLARAETELGVVFSRAAGIVHTAQPPETLARIEILAGKLDDFALAGLAAAAGLFGSAILGFALQRGWMDAAAAFDLSQLDETWQQARWGVDAEAAARTAGLRREALALGRWFEALAAD